MKLKEFLTKVGSKKWNIINYTGKYALKAVEQNGFDLKYVKEQTEAVCLKAVENNGYALQYVDKRIFDA